MGLHACMCVCVPAMHAHVYECVCMCVYTCAHMGMWLFRALSTRLTMGSPLISLASACLRNICWPHSTPTSEPPSFRSSLLDPPCVAPSLSVKVSVHVERQQSAGEESKFILARSLGPSRMAWVPGIGWHFQNGKVCDVELPPVFPHGTDGNCLSGSIQEKNTPNLPTDGLVLQ